MSSGYALSPSASKTFLCSIKSKLLKPGSRLRYIRPSNPVKRRSSYSISHTCGLISLCRCNDERDFKVRSEAVPESTNSVISTNARMLGTLILGSMFVVWYMVNIYFNVFNKKVLKVFPYPATVTAFQFGCSSTMVFLMWALNLHPKPKITRSQFEAIFLLALGHTAGNLLTNVSLGKVAVSFTHTIKAMEPFFTVLLSALFVGEVPSVWVVASLVPVVGGVALASFTEVSFNCIGFGSAMASNLTNQTRNVFSKKFMIRKEEKLDNINLFSAITVTSFLLTVNNGRHLS